MIDITTFYNFKDPLDPVVEAITLFIYSVGMYFPIKPRKLFDVFIKNKNIFLNNYNVLLPKL
jgi:hypothetical protein